ncbi:MAG TPA: hypothetical protein VGQ99_10830 [Tepidisphaeraceae bacterium]|nr:hypothetical protein [Tepidisphaeraceae bacterium]
MIRWIFRTVTFLLFAGCASLWVRSYWVSEQLQYRSITQDGRAFTRTIFTIASGEAGVYWNSTKESWTAKNQAQADSQLSEFAKNGWSQTPLEAGYAGNAFALTKQPRQWGFGHHESQGIAAGVTSASSSYVFPFAAPTAFFGLLPAWGLFRIIVPSSNKRKYVVSNEFADSTYLLSTESRLGTADERDVVTRNVPEEGALN